VARVGSSLSSLAVVLLILGLAETARSQEPSPDFDHTATRFVLTGAHESVPCQGCHNVGIFRGTPTDCSFCHDGSGMRAESGKPLDHVRTSNRCEDCHVAVTWLEVRFDHIAVLGSCSSCHNGGGAAGKPISHIATNEECDVCHNTIIWSVVRFDHDNVTSPCSSCHNGVTATGKDNGHLQTNAECDLCHSTRAWRPTTFDHSAVTGNCSSCHNGIAATGQPNGHFITTQDCDVCHTQNRWRPDIFRHASPNYPGDHAGGLKCTECHPGNSEMVVYTDDPSLAPDCAGCHRNDYRTGPHKKYENPDTKYNVQELRDCAGACHTYTDATLTQIKKTRNGEHRVSDREF
jgi:hypothetical protein